MMLMLIPPPLLFVVCNSGFDLQAQGTSEVQGHFFSSFHCITSLYHICDGL